MASWSITFPFNPLATPRPNFTFKKGKVITYYKTEYAAYLSALDSYIASQCKYNANFDEVVNSKYGVIANIIFYIGSSSKDQFTHTSKPDIDNLVKATMDGIFNNLKVKDSRVVGIKVLKLNTASNPRTEVTLTGLTDLNDEEPSKVSSKVDQALQKANPQKSWAAVFPFAPMATPRPTITFTKTKDGKYQRHTYNSTKYHQYLEKMNQYLKLNDLYNEELNEVVSSEQGVIARVNFFCKVPKNQKTIRKFLKMTAPDIDNLLKAVLDGIFNNIATDDSHVVGVQALKFNEIDMPRTEITLTGLTR